MRAFNSLSILAFLLSAGHIAHALPPSHRAGLIAHRQHNIPDYYNGNPASYGAGEDAVPVPGDQLSSNAVDVQGEVWTLKGELDTRLARLGRCKDIEQATEQVTIILETIRKETSQLTSASVNLPVEAHAKLLSTKFGSPLVINVLADIDAAFSEYLSALINCAPGMKQAMIKIAGQMNKEAVADLGLVGFTRCAKILGLTTGISGVAQ
ncbi:hypothetical protein AG1IA_08615 [Rhizoctonia solani AG-1 IA]|uniref:Uncharacterized protein n=1 Tax=Thanatephorus cucumeris (strain AG1-IA) TaxID=983506 RepID=L8WKU2_THACA|nr:hypothetical protein AG1IA_08615 [Rhizoctonia solani AG-1 IA]